MRKLSMMISLAAALGLAAPAAASAQWEVIRRPEQGRISRIPPGHLPPRGYCRVWIDGRSPGRQPPVMRCREAERLRQRYGSRAFVVYGDRVHSRGGDVSRRRDDDTRTRVYARIIDGRRCKVAETWRHGRRIDTRTVCERAPSRRVRH